MYFWDNINKKKILQCIFKLVLQDVDCICSFNFLARILSATSNSARYLKILSGRWLLAAPSTFKLFDASTCINLEVVFQCLTKFTSRNGKWLLLFIWKKIPNMLHLWSLSLWVRMPCHCISSFHCALNMHSCQIFSKLKELLTFWVWVTRCVLVLGFWTLQYHINSSVVVLSKHLNKPYVVGWSDLLFF